MVTPAQAAAEIVKSHHKLGMIETAVILDRNFYGVADTMDDATSIDFADLPGFPQTARTDDARVIVGTIDGFSALLMKGRASFFEIGDPSLMSTPIEMLTHLGVRCLLSTTPAVSTRADLVPSSLVMITDHINFSGLNPLVGSNSDKSFVNMNEAYDRRLLRRLKTAAGSSGVTIHEGVLMWCSGPSFETPAEIKVARQLGADLVGWSLAPEAILARRYGIPFAGVAIVTDFGAGFSNGNPSADFTRGSAVAGAVALKRLVRGFVKIR